MSRVRLRLPIAEDIPLFYAQQTDPIACDLAAYPPREWERFDHNWRNSIEDPAVISRTILVNDVVAGHLISWSDGESRLFGYWLERALWGRGIMTSALAQFLPLVESRPLHAIVAKHNPASARLLLRAGFAETQRVIADDGVPEIHFRLD